MSLFNSHTFNVSAKTNPFKHFIVGNLKHCNGCHPCSKSTFTNFLSLNYKTSKFLVKSYGFDEHIFNLNVSLPQPWIQITKLENVTAAITSV